jgi:dihydrofolate synthase / folylpolyglutamate synthase
MKANSWNRTVWVAKATQTAIDASPDQALSAWLARLEQRSPESRIELGLERVARVWRRIGLDLADRIVVTVGGTNGKGSTVAFIEQMALAAGHETFAYTSPHLFDFAERMRINGKLASSPDLVAALDQVESARGDTFLTYFEHITLAGLCLAESSSAKLLILEVGLGGRLDAVNIIDPDVAIITSIGLDHTDWLGPNRLAIGREKAGIARPGKPLIVGEKYLPSGFLPVLEGLKSRLYLAGRDFFWRSTPSGFSLKTGQIIRRFPKPAMAGRWQLANAACAIVALDTLQKRLPVDLRACKSGLVTARMPGRMQQMGRNGRVWLDVAHNAAAARALAAELGPARGRSIAVFSALTGKDVSSIVRALKHCFDGWMVPQLSGDRARDAGELAAELQQAAVTGHVETVESVPEALRRALAQAGADGRVVVFGSFRTVAEAWPELETLE